MGPVLPQDPYFEAPSQTSVFQQAPELISVNKSLFISGNMTHKKHTPTQKTFKTAHHKEKYSKTLKTLERMACMRARDEWRLDVSVSRRPRDLILIVSVSSRLEL